MHQLPQSYLRGRTVDQLPLDADYVDGILETVRCHNGSLPLWPLHRARLQRAGVLGGAYLAEIEQATLMSAAACPWAGAIARLRIGSIEGKACWDLAFRPLEMTREEQVGTRLFPCSTTLSVNGNLNLGCKTLARNRYNAAKAELPDRQCLDGLMLDSAGRVVESLRCNILARFGKEWVTPNLQRCGVRGVMREWLFSHTFWQVRDMDIAALCRADELALCNSVRGVLPVVEIVGYKTWSVGPETQRLQKLIVEKLW
ncbi:aminotransferase class IV [Microbulbifer sp. OS29]|uniref:Aminotransferase class IV n=1 Tax=Microbulbifer okhotskensis TaxID=2926617 RepID=A0A9X2J553_9GAMM|nr:aminotransferase class IV [Microbulbifer okhotskensis]MCO1333989.1 aminotransferase class IV [Microbulbifer okhotskensis]